MSPFERSDSTMQTGYTSGRRKSEPVASKRGAPTPGKNPPHSSRKRWRTGSSRKTPRRVFAAVVDEHGVVGTGEVLRVSDTCNEIGYAVHTDYWGRGLGTRIARALVSVAFDDRIERVQATCDPRNAASRAVLQRVGMSVEGTLRRTMLLRDGWRDSLMHSVLRSEWPPSSE